MAVTVKEKIADRRDSNSHMVRRCNARLTQAMVLPLHPGGDICWWYTRRDQGASNEQVKNLAHMGSMREQVAYAQTLMIIFDVSS